MILASFVSTHSELTEGILAAVGGLLLIAGRRMHKSVKSIDKAVNSRPAGDESLYNVVVDGQKILSDGQKAINDRLSGIDDRLSGIDDRLDGVDDRVERRKWSK